MKGESQNLYPAKKRSTLSTPLFFIKVARMPGGKRDLTFVLGNIIKSFGARKGLPEAARMLQGGIRRDSRNEITSKFFAGSRGKRKGRRLTPEESV